MQLKTARQVIEALGGPHAVAALFATDVRLVFNWQRRKRLPPDTYAVLSGALRERRLEHDPRAFGQRPSATPTQLAAWKPYQPPKRLERA
jgi:hypothetical protein